MACTHVVQGLISVGAESPAVMFALAKGHEGTALSLMADVMLFALAVGLAAISEDSLLRRPTDSCVISDGEDMLEEASAEMGEAKVAGDDDNEQGTGGGLDLVGGVLRAIALLLRMQWKAESERTGAESGKKRKKGWGMAGSGAGVLILGGGNFKRALVEHHLVGRTLVGGLFDALNAFFVELDTASPDRRKTVLLYVAGAVEILFVCR